MEAITFKLKNGPYTTGLYRPFKTPNKMTYLENLIEHLKQIPESEENFIIGDLNLDFARSERQNISKQETL